MLARPLRMAPEFNAASRFSIADRLEFRADFSSAQRELVDPVNLPAAQGPSTQLAVQRAALQVLAAQAHPEDVRALVLVRDSAVLVPVALAVNVQVVERFRPRAKLRARSAQLDVRAAETSNIQRPRKAR
jgi:hypothetical protein